MNALTAGLRRAPRLVALAAWTLWAVVTSSAMVARDIIAPSARLQPAIVVVPNRCVTRGELALFNGLVTITPGTLLVGLDSDRGEVWVHGMYGADPDALRAEVDDVQSRVIRALRLTAGTTVAGGGR